ncbi:MAG: GNAT family N-acetyltransferase, partial [Lentisphaerae bacterium]|nr:GNAT family N-acetyltransferase [Lentisphaerota bacterium]
FVSAPVSDFPEKVWSDCLACPKRHCCDEVALVMPLQNN